MVEEHEAFNFARLGPLLLSPRWPRKIVSIVLVARMDNRERGYRERASKNPRPFSKKRTQNCTEKIRHCPSSATTRCHCGPIHGMN